MKKTIPLRVGVILGMLATLLVVAPPGAQAATVPIELCAKAGSTTMPDGQNVTVYGYAVPSTAGDCSTTTVSAPGGPVIEAGVGDTVEVTLDNALGDATAMLFAGQEMIPDLEGIDPGASKTYSFVASTPGTFLYEAGLLPNIEYQTAMGLHGALVVHDTSTYDVEAPIVVSEIDPALNNAADPATFDLRDFAPKYGLLNGAAFPDTTNVAVAAGDDVLLRFVNAGLLPHSMAVLGLQQSVLNTDGGLLPFPEGSVAETLAPGESVDAVVSIPATGADGSRFAVYDASMMLRNGKAAGFGGALTFLEVSGTPVGSGTPTVSGTTLNPSRTDGSVDVDLTATVAAPSGDPADGAQYAIDDASFTSPTTMTFAGTAASAAIPAATVDALTSGNHTVYVRAHNVAGWGASDFAVLHVDKTGPVTSALVLTPNPTNGTKDVALTGTGDDSSTGKSAVVAAEYAIDDGTAVAITIATPTTVVALSATIDAATVNGLSEGSHAISVRSQDALGSWGDPATIDLVVDKTGPTTTSVVATPNPTNAKTGVNASTPAIRIIATIADDSGIAKAEGFIDTVGADGSGFPVIPSSGIPGETSVLAYADIPLSTINQLSDGSHTIYVHGKDAAGNWGATDSTQLIVDKTAPTFSGISLSPNPTYGAATVTMTVNGASDGTGTGVTGGEYWICSTTCAAPTQGTATAFTGTSPSISVGSLAVGTYTVYARIRDAAGNWSAGTEGIRSTILWVWPDAIFSNGFESGNTSAWSSRSTGNNGGNGRLSVTTGAAMTGTYGLRASGNNTNYVQYNFGTAANPAAPTFDARFQFRPNGNTSTGKDIFTAATSSTFNTTVFRVRYRLNSGTPQVQIQVGTSNTNTTWTNILGGTSTNTIEVVWQANNSAVYGGANPGSLRLYVNGTLAQTLTTSSNNWVGAFRLGSVTSTGNSTDLHFDGFVAKRTTSPLVGP
jgi:hypothetical protein